MSPATISSAALKYPIFLPNKGPKQDVPKEFLQDIVSPYSRNMELLNELVQARLGMAKLVSTQLNGYVLSQPFLDKFNGNKFNLFCTPTHIYSLDYSNTRFDILNPTYTTGTIEVQAGTPTILRGTGTSWNANAKAGDFVKIGAGSINTDSTWYEVESVDSDTQITLTSSAATTAAGASYVLIQVFTGGNTDFWDWEQFLDTNQGEVVIMTNGVDKPYYWTGSGQVTVFGTLATGFTAARFVDVYKDRILFLDNVEGGGRQPQRERWSGVADLTDWTDTDFRDFVDEPTFITGTARYAGFHVVFKRTNAYVGRAVTGDDVFDYDLATECEGCRSRFSIIEHQKFLAYYGDDKKIHKWNLLQDIIVTEPIFTETKEFDPNADEWVQGFEVKHKNQMRFFCPYGDTALNNYIIVWDYVKEDVKVWDCAEANALSTMGRLFLSDDVYADDPVFGELYADETSGFADDSSQLANAALTLYGGYDGYIRIADSGSDDDGSEFTRLLRFKRLNFRLTDRRKRLQRQRWWLDSEASGTVTIKMRLNESGSYDADTKSLSLVPSSDEEVVKLMTTWDKHAITFQPEISATNFFALHGFENYLFPKGSG